MEVTMFGVICDCCQKQLEVHNKVSYWTEEARAEFVALEMDWIINEEADLYCPQCAKVDEDGAIILDESRRNFHTETINAEDCGDQIGQEEPPHPSPEQDEDYYNGLQDGAERMKMADAIEEAESNNDHSRDNFDSDDYKQTYTN